MRDLAISFGRRSPWRSTPTWGPSSPLTLHQSWDNHGSQSHIFSELTLRVKPREDFLISTLKAEAPSPSTCTLLTPSPLSALPTFQKHTRHISKSATQEGHTCREQNVYKMFTFLFKKFTWVSLPHIPLLREGIDYTFTPQNTVFASPNLP